MTNEEVIGVPVKSLIGFCYSETDIKLRGEGWVYALQSGGSLYNNKETAPDHMDDSDQFVTSTYLKKNVILVLTQRYEQPMKCVCVTLITPEGSVYYGGW